LARASLTTVVLPLSFRWVSHRRIRVFISFNREIEPVACEVQACFQRVGIDAMRIPYSSKASHQEIVEGVLRGIKSSDVVVCLPGTSQSFVESEVLAATTAGKPIVFVVSQDGGTLPNTADKRYPVVSLEKTTANNFSALSSFVEYVGNSFSSNMRLCLSSLMHPWLMFSASKLLYAYCAIVGLLFVLCYFSVRIAVPAGNLGLSEAAALLAQFMIIFITSSLAVAFCLYTVLFLHKFFRQIMISQTGRLRMASGEFCKSDWNNIVPDVRDADELYESLFEHAPYAHHEILSS
jgi:hypothetical protein